MLCEGSVHITRARIMAVSSKSGSPFRITVRAFVPPASPARDIVATIQPAASPPFVVISKTARTDPGVWRPT